MFTNYRKICCSFDMNRVKMAANRKKVVALENFEQRACTPRMRQDSSDVKAIRGRARHVLNSP